MTLGPNAGEVDRRSTADHRNAADAGAEYARGIVCGASAPASIQDEFRLQTSRVLERARGAAATGGFAKRMAGLQTTRGLM